MVERFAFSPDHNLGDVLHALATPRGQEFIGRTAGEFSSLVDVFHSTYAVGSSTLVHEPDGGNVVFQNVGPREFARAALIVTGIYGFNVA